MRTSWVLPLFAGAILLTGCDIEIGDFGNSERFQTDFRYNYPLKAGGTFTLETMNGSVDIAGWDRDEVEITGVKYAKTEALRDAIRIDVSHSDTAASVRTVAPYDNHGGVGARYTIRVPKRVTLDRVTSSNGKIHVSDIDGDARLRTSNGGVQVIHVTGKVDAQSSNGAVNANGTGPAHLHTSNGHIEAEGIKGPVDATSSNGSVTVAMTDGLSGEVRASTSNSSITVKLPSNAPARLRASTSNSSISTDFAMNTSGGREDRKHLEGEINGGSSSSPLVDLTTSNGSIHIVKL